MTYDEDLVERIRDVWPPGLEVAEKKMFGGLAFLVGGHLSVAAGSEATLMVRCDPVATDRLEAESGVTRMVMRGRALSGWLQVDAARVGPDDAGMRALARWVGVGIDYAGSLPPR